MSEQPQALKPEHEALKKIADDIAAIHDSYLHRHGIHVKPHMNGHLAGVILSGLYEVTGPGLHDMALNAANKIRSLRSRLAIQTEALKQIERPVADMIRIRDDKTIVWDFHKECDANLEPLAEALQAVRNALAQSETPAPQENPKSQLVEERLEEIARRLQDKLTGCTEHVSWFVKSNSHKMILSALREASSLPEQVDCPICHQRHEP